MELLTRHSPCPERCGDHVKVAHVACRDLATKGDHLGRWAVQTKHEPHTIEIGGSQQESRALVAIGKRVPLPNPSQEHRRLVKRRGMRVFSPVGLKAGCYHLLDKARLPDRARPAAELADRQHIEIDSRGGQVTNLGNRALRFGTGKIDWFGQPELNLGEQSRKFRITGFCHPRRDRLRIATTRITRRPTPRGSRAHPRAW
ncbi:MAG: hypothetical protein K0Q71_2028 [Thermomicrobiales bacterium]|nr:hypothetical protein [Thermomicrobiales bacterium]